MQMVPIRPRRHRALYQGSFMNPFVEQNWQVLYDKDVQLLAEMALVDDTNNIRYRACLARVQARERVQQKRLLSSSTKRPASTS